MLVADVTIYSYESHDTLSSNFGDKRIPVLTSNYREKMCLHRCRSPTAFAALCFCSLVRVYERTSLAVCLANCAFRIENPWMVFDDMNIMPFWVHPKLVRFNVLQSAMITWRMYELLSSERHKRHYRNAVNIVIKTFGNQSSLCGICGGQSDAGAGSPRSTSIFPVSIIPQMLHSRSYVGVFWRFVMLAGDSIVK